MEAEAERVWKSGGARRPSYPSIVGAGQNSTILHYPRSERVMQAGDLILMEAIGGGAPEHCVLYGSAAGRGSFWQR